MKNSKNLITKLILFVIATIFLKSCNNNSTDYYSESVGSNTAAVLSVSPSETINIGLKDSVKVLKIMNLGGKTLQWEVISSANWLSYNPQNGTDSGSITVKLDKNLFVNDEIGSYLTITSNGGEETVDFSLYTGYTLNICRENPQYFSALKSHCYCSSTYTDSVKLSVLANCLGVTIPEKIKKISLTYDVSTSASSDYTKAYLYLYDSKKGVTIGNSSMYSSQLQYKSHEHVVFDLIHAYKADDLYLIAFPGDWCSSFRINEMLVQ